MFDACGIGDLSPLARQRDMNRGLGASFPNLKRDDSPATRSARVVCGLARSPMLGGVDCRMGNALTMPEITESIDYIRKYLKLASR